MSGKNPPVLKPTTGRRSGRRSRGGGGTTGEDAVVAPGFGTKKDIEQLSHDLSVGGEATLPSAAVEAMMNSRGRGILSPGAKEPNAKPGATSSAWADFMKEEGVDLHGSGDGATTTAASGNGAASNNTAAAVQAQNDAEALKKKALSKKKAASGSKRKKSYQLPILLGDSDNGSSEPATKKAKTSASQGKGGRGGVLLQTGTLDVTVVGRKGLSKEAPSYQLVKPTRILPGINITKVFTSSNACHSIALDASGKAYGWGRNDQGQLTKDFPANVATPTLLQGGGLEYDDYTIVSAAVGKFHTLLLTSEGTVLAVGSNKLGQCGIKSSTEHVNQFKPCVFPPTVKIVQISCGEQFSVALSDQGQIYTTGASEYGQLGNGETGEYFITASKLAFANCNVFTLRNQFMERDPTQESTKDKLLPIAEDIRFQSIACGKNHTLAVEANYTEDGDGDDDVPPRPRVFSWGCGNYGVLGHGIQSDEYFPREIAALGSHIWLPPGPLLVKAGAGCSLLQTSNGQVYYWGKHRSAGEAELRPRLVEALANNMHVVDHCDGGGQTVVCCTNNAQTVAWGQGPHGELGLGAPKSSAKPQFLDTLTGCRISDLACGYGHTLYVVKDEDAEDKAAIEKLPLLNENAKSELEAVWASAPKSDGGKVGKSKKKR